MEHRNFEVAVLHPRTHTLLPILGRGIGHASYTSWLVVTVTVRIRAPHFVRQQAPASQYSLPDLFTMSKTPGMRDVDDA
eukprot:4142672-Pyramimonas_sp.AAC.4